MHTHIRTYIHVCMHEYSTESTEEGQNLHTESSKQGLPGNDSLYIWSGNTDCTPPDDQTPDVGSISIYLIVILWGLTFSIVWTMFYPTNRFDILWLLKKTIHMNIFACLTLLSNWRFKPDTAEPFLHFSCDNTLCIHLLLRISLFTNSEWF